MSFMTKDEALRRTDYLLAKLKRSLEELEALEKSLDEMVELLKEALAFDGRTKGRERIIEDGLTNELVAKRIIEIYERILEQKHR